MSKPTCASCRFFRAHYIWMDGVRHDDGECGRCHRRSPRGNSFPEVHRDDWCGEHEPGEGE